MASHQDGHLRPGERDRLDRARGSHAGEARTRKVINLDRAVLANAESGAAITRRDLPCGRNNCDPSLRRVQHHHRRHRRDANGSPVVVGRPSNHLHALIPEFELGAIGWVAASGYVDESPPVDESRSVADETREVASCPRAVGIASDDVDQAPFLARRADVDSDLDRISAVIGCPEGSRSGERQQGFVFESRPVSDAEGRADERSRRFR
jgi:hypothetical protein